MFSKLQEDTNKVELGIKNLRKALHFVSNNYDYHHKNDENIILEEKRKILDAVETSCIQFKDSFLEFERLMEKTEKRINLIDEKINYTIQKFNLDSSLIIPSKAEQNLKLNEKDVTVAQP